MEERRKSKRSELKSSIVIKRLDTKEDAEVGIEILDVSKTGVGFSCNQVLNIGAVYESFLTIWTKEVLHAFLEIRRIEKTGESYNYGAVFIGMPELEVSRIAVYQTLEENRQE